MSSRYVATTTSLSLDTQALEDRAGRHGDRHLVPSKIALTLSRF